MSDIATFVAATTEAIHQTWYDYVRYLAAQLALLDEAHDEDASFERGEGGTTAAAHARTTLAAIPFSRRTVFDAVLEHERQRALVAAEAEQRAEGGRGALDPQTIERALLQRLYDEAHGRGTPTEGRGWVPLAADDDQWYEVDVQALTDAPQAGAYRLRAMTDERRRGFTQAGVVAAVSLLVLLVWFLWPSTATPRDEQAVLPMSGEQELTPWPVTHIVVTTNTATTTLSVSATTSAVWSAPADAAPLALWRSTSVLPLTLCLPPDLLAGATRVTLKGDSTTPERSYTLQDPASGTSDLIVESCAALSDGSLLRRYGLLQAVAFPSALPLEQEIPVGTTRLKVTSISQRGVGDDPTLPPQTNRVEVVVTTSAVLSWPQWAPTLLLPDGQTLAPSGVETTSDGALLRYLVPERAGPLPVQWRLTPPDGSDLLRWQATLPPPPTRTDVLRSRLRVLDVAIAEQRSDTISLALALENTSDTPLPLLASDVSVTSDEQALPVPELAALASPLAPQEQRTVTLTLPRPDPAASFVVAVGPYRYAIQPID